MKATKSHRIFFQLAVSKMPHTEGIEFGLLLTPTTSEPVHDLEKFKARMEKYPNGTTMPNLATQVHGMLPTPTGMEDRRIPNGSERDNELKSNMNAHTYMERVGMLPTPLSSDNGEKITGLENQNSLTKMARQLTGKTSQLSPRFVEEMMGFPKGWTASPFQSGEGNPSRHTGMR
tara:strand:+ start:551 stop:1075 length:525 start_codon:yes stop_codon:yes gene_type:complete